MKNHDRSTLVAAVALTIGLTAFGIVGVRANPRLSEGHINDLVMAIAQKFNLSESDVQKIFDEHHAQRERERAQAYSDRIREAVKNGTLTQDQAISIIAKQQELDSLKASIKDKPKEERRALMKAQLESLRQWAATNNIPMEYLMLGGHGMGRSPHGGLQGHVWRMGGPDTSPSLPPTE